MFRWTILQMPLYIVNISNPWWISWLMLEPLITNNWLVLQLVVGLTDAYAHIGTQIRHDDTLPLLQGPIHASNSDNSDDSYPASKSCQSDSRGDGYGQTGGRGRRNNHSRRGRRSNDNHFSR